MSVAPAVTGRGGDARLRCSSGIGAAYGTAKSGIGIAGVGTFRPDLIMKVSLAGGGPDALNRC